MGRIAPPHHGILANRWLDADGTLRRPYADDDVAPWRQKRVPSLVELAAAKKLSVAALNWPGSQGSKQIRWNLPEMYAVRASYRLLSPDLTALVDRYFARLARCGRNAHYRHDLVDRLAADSSSWKARRIGAAGATCGSGSPRSSPCS